MAGTLKIAVDKINALPAAPAFLLHTGDLTHLSKPEEFDTVAEIFKGAKVGKASSCPASTTCSPTTASATGALRQGRAGAGWQSFDYHGVHFIGLVNVMNLKAGGLGVLGADQLDWLKKDVAGLGDSTPIVVFAHVPLWTVYEKWGWGTADAAAGAGAAEALRLGDGAERPHPSGAAEGGGERDVPHGLLDRVPATGAGQGALAGAGEGRAGGEAARACWA